MSQPTPGSVRSTFPQAIHEMLDLLGVDYLEWPRVSSRTGDYDHLHSRADGFYLPALDFISVRGTSSPVGSPTTVLLHELIHWAGARKRLSRPMVCAAARGILPSAQEVATEEATAQYGMFMLAEHFDLRTSTVAKYLSTYLAMYPLADLPLARAQAADAVKYILEGVAAAKIVVDSAKQAA